MLFKVSRSSWIMSWILALQFLISLSLPFTHAAPVSDLVQLSGSVGHDTAPLPAASDEFEKYLSKRSPGITGNAWFIRTRSNGDKIFGFGPDVGSKYLPTMQLGTITLQTGGVGSGSYATVTEGILFEFDNPRPRSQDLEPEPCGDHQLEPGGYVPRVYKDLWIPVCRDYPQGESLVVMEKMGRDMFDIMGDFPTAYARKEPWASAFSRFYMIKDLLDGLNYAHMHQYIHVDVKPENVMQRIPTVRSRLQHFNSIDWDFAIDLREHQTSWLRKGSRLFMAPEVVKGEYWRWPYAPDVYSAGLCLLYAIRPGLQDNRYDTTVMGMANYYLSEKGVRKYLVRNALLSEGPADLLDLLSQVLCAPTIRLTMAEFATELGKLADVPGRGGDLPLFLERS